ncbi:MAG: GDSL-type esterase/lipase family protein [Bacteroidetes bacterium]|nr:GDSL-type esterase/lipase family protein [Bacteroidota bacterium]
MNKILLLSLGFLASSAMAQDPARFNKEVAGIASSHRGQKADVVLLGSSSVKMWQDCHECLQEYTVINSGFGGSQTSDLLVHWPVLTLEHEPKIVFVYEGDNDLAAGESPDSIILEMKQWVEQAQEAMPQTLIILVGAKPSPSRLRFEEQYFQFNDLLYALCEEMGLGYVDTWGALADYGAVREEYFLADRLHLNADGYVHWCEAFRRTLADFEARGMLE